jgi:predicted PurR-regulated permease PerM
MKSRPLRSRRYRSRVRIDLTPRTMLVIVVAVGLVWLLSQLVPVVLVIVSGMMLAGTMAPLVTWLEHRRLGRGTSIAFAFISVVVIFALLGVLTLPRLFGQLSELVNHVPQMQATVVDLLHKVKALAPLAQSIQNAKSPELIANAMRMGLSYSPKIVETVGYAVTAVFLALYLLIDRDRMRGGFFALVPRRHHVRLSRVVLGLETIVGGYVRGQVLTSILMGIFTFIVLLVAGVPNAIALAVFAALADVLPYIGGLLACGPAVLSALPHGVGTGIAVLVALVIYQEFESRFIVPRVYGNVLRLPSAVVVVALLIGGNLLGVLGALLALPIAAGIRLIIEELRFELPGEAPENHRSITRDRQEEMEYARRAAGVPVDKAAEIATEIAQVSLDQDARNGAADNEEPRDREIARPSLEVPPSGRS